MRRRDQVAERPDRPPYVRLVLDVPREPAGPWVFRIPRLSVARPLFDALAHASRDDAPDAELDAAYGAILLASWADEVYALEFHDGASVFEELYEAGWSQAAMWGTARAIQQRAMEGAPTLQEVASKVDFFDRPGAFAASLSSGSASSGSGTSSDSTG